MANKTKKIVVSILAAAVIATTFPCSISSSGYSLEIEVQSGVDVGYLYSNLGGVYAYGTTILHYQQEQLVYHLENGVVDNEKNYYPSYVSVDF